MKGQSRVHTVSFQLSTRKSDLPAMDFYSWQDTASTPGLTLTHSQLEWLLQNHYRQRSSQHHQQHGAQTCRQTRQHGQITVAARVTTQWVLRSQN